MTVEPESDAGLVVEHQSGSPRAFAELYVRHYARLVRFCRTRVGNAAIAEDIVQEAFTQALARMDRLQGERRFYPWVRLIAWRLVIDHYRRIRLAQAVMEREAREPVTVVDSPETVFVRAVATTQVRQALARLPERQRRVLVLREFDGCSYAEIAQALDVADTAVPALLHRARQALAREYLAVTWGERFNAVSVWATGLAFGWRRRIGQWSRWLPEPSALTVPALTAVLAAGSAIGALAGVSATPPVQQRVSFDQATATPAVTVSRRPAGTGPEATHAAIGRRPQLAPQVGNARIGPRVDNAGSFEGGLARFHRGEDAYSDREQARRMPHYFEAGPFYWGADPQQALRDAHAIADGAYGNS